MGALGANRQNVKRAAGYWRLIVLSIILYVAVAESKRQKSLSNFGAVEDNPNLLC